MSEDTGAVRAGSVGMEGDAELPQHVGGVDGVYISNGTMGHMWMHENCERCVKEHMNHPEVLGPGCPVLDALYMQAYPIEGLVRQDDHLWPVSLKCSYFTPCADCGVDPDYRPSSWLDDEPPAAVAGRVGGGAEGREEVGT